MIGLQVERGAGVTWYLSYMAIPEVDCADRTARTSADPASIDSGQMESTSETPVE